jgi:hypothetical protein
MRKSPDDLIKYFTLIKQSEIDFFTVPTATFRVLCVFIILSHDRRRVVHMNVTAQPTAAWTRQHTREALPDDDAPASPAYMVRDRDGVYGSDFGEFMKRFDIDEILTAPDRLGKIPSPSA